MPHIGGNEANGPADDHAMISLGELGLTLNPDTMLAAEALWEYEGLRARFYDIAEIPDIDCTALAHAESATVELTEESSGYEFIVTAHGIVTATAQVLVAQVLYPEGMQQAQR